MSSPRLFTLLVMFMGGFGLGNTASALDSCRSEVLNARDLGGYQPIGGPAAVESAEHGTDKEIPVRDRRSGQACIATVTCDDGYWDFEGVDCSNVQRRCDATTWTVYDLGGWSPVGGYVRLPASRNHEEFSFRSEASDGRRCTIIAECNTGVWRPNWAASACPGSRR